MNDASKKIEFQEVRSPRNNETRAESPLIPSSFWLGGQQIDVVFEETLLKSRRILGEANYPEQKIYLV